MLCSAEAIPSQTSFTTDSGLAPSAIPSLSAAATTSCGVSKRANGRMPC
jgi:hypothetical protein